MGTPKVKPKTSRQSASLKHGWRSGLEESVGKQLEDLGVDYKYESFKIPWADINYRSYTPDYLLPNGIIVETKGRFVVSDRMKHLKIKEQHPMLDIRFVFSNPNNRISKTSKTTYSKWCDNHGFLWAKKEVPECWLTEAPKDYDVLEYIEGITR